MIKLYSSLALLAFTLPAMAQQLPNNGFEDNWGNCTPWTSSNNTRTKGTTPAPWCISQVIGLNGTGATQVGEEAAGYNSNKAAKVYNSPNTASSSKIVPGYITLGTAWNTAKGMSGSNADGGTFGGIEFTNRPDAISFDYKHTGSDQATVVAYMWKGQTTQASVPADIGFLSPVSVNMVNRDRNILDKKTDQGGNVTKSDDFALIASIEKRFSGSDNWKNTVIPFDYKSTDAPSMFNVIFAASDYFSTSVPNGQELTVDNVKLVYYSRLSSIKFKGNEVLTSDTNYTYDLGELSVKPSSKDFETVVIGNGATAKVSVKTSSVVITVTNAGADTDGESTHTYTLNYTVKAPSSSSLTTLSVNGKYVTGFNPTAYTYNLGELEQAPALDDIVATPKDAEATVNTTVGYQVIKVTVSNPKATNPESVYTLNYTIKVNAVPTSGNSHEGWLNVTLGDPIVVNDLTSVIITEPVNGKCIFALPNFSFMGNVIGDIVIPNVEVNGNNYSGSFNGLALAGGEIIANVKVNGTISETGVANFQIPVTWAMNRDNIYDPATATPINVTLSGSNPEGTTTHNVFAKVCGAVADVIYVTDEPTVLTIVPAEEGLCTLLFNTTTDGIGRVVVKHVDTDGSAFASSDSTIALYGKESHSAKVTGKIANGAIDFLNINDGKYDITLSTNKVNAITEVGSNTNALKAYDLQGRRVNGSARGIILLENGTKVIR